MKGIPKKMSLAWLVPLNSIGEHSLSVSAAMLAMTSTTAASAFIAAPSRRRKPFFHHPTKLASVFDKGGDSSFIPDDFDESIILKTKSLRATLVRRF
jgi:hypothetical protein